MDLTNFHQLLGWTNTDAQLAQSVKQYGAEVTALSPKKFKELNTDFIELAESGMSLSFSPRESFQITYCVPKGDGPYVLSGVIYYPSGGKRVSPYTGIAPYAKSAVKSRDDALLAYGKPVETEEDDGDIDWDRWEIDGHWVSVSYRSDLSVTTITVSMPMVDS